MFLKKRIGKSTDAYWDELARLQEALEQADALLIGAGSGLSASAGLSYSGERFERYFADFQEKYGINDMYSGGFYPFDSLEEYWAWWSRHIWWNRYEPQTNTTYSDLFALVKDQDYFVLTTNVDQQFFRVFPQEQICAFQGDFSYCQCSQPCRDDIWENRELVKELTGRLVGVRLPEEAVPRCPDCGRVLVPWVRDDTFLEGTFWQDNLHRYHRFLRRWIMDQSDKKVLLLELGVGEMTPSIIKLPFWELTAKNENVFYACLNREASHSPEHLRGRSLYLQGDLAETLAALRQVQSIAATIK